MPLAGTNPRIEENPTHAVHTDLFGALAWWWKIIGSPQPEEFTLPGVRISLGKTTVSSLTRNVVAMQFATLQPTMLHYHHFDVALARESIEQFPQLEDRNPTPQGELANLTPSLSSTNIRSTTITPAAEKYARSLGLYGALVLTKGLVRETIHSIKALNIDKREDPDEGGYSTICFTITIPESVDRALELDDALQDVLYDNLPPDALFYFTFTYRFE